MKVSLSFTQADDASEQEDLDIFISTFILHCPEARGHIFK